MRLDDFIDRRAFEEARAQDGLDEAQAAVYNRDGFLVLRGALDVAELKPHLENAQRVRSINPRKVFQPHLLEPAFADYCQRRVLPLIDRVNGASQLFESFIFYKKPGETRTKPWHQDGVYWNPSTSRLVAGFVPLTPTTLANGCLHVLPGSHRLGRIHHRIEPDGHGLDNLVCDIAALRAPEPLELNPGDLALVHTLTIHGSFGNPSDQDWVMLGFHCRHEDTRLERLDAQGLVPRLGRMLTRATAVW